MNQNKFFSHDQLQRIVDETLPADAKLGEKVVVGTIDQNGVQVMASFKLKQHWELQAVARHEWSGNDVVGAKVLLRWE